jgi:hypothetical protein
MNFLDAVRPLFDHMEWADATVWRAIRRLHIRLRELGTTPPLVDFIAWAWAGKPSPDWG